MDFTPYASQTIQEEDFRAVRESLGNTLITRGPCVASFEELLAKESGSRYAVAFHSGTIALSAAGFAADIRKEDRLYSSANTFVGTLSGALQRTSRLHFLDIDPETGSPDFAERDYESDSGRAILFPIHYSGIAKRFPKPKNSVVIEDAAQAFGSVYKEGGKVGACPDSDMTVFSFHPAKTICMGEGGAVTTNDKNYYERLLLFRNNGIVRKDAWHYDVTELTSNYNVTELQAALGISQYSRLSSFLENRKKLVKRYRFLLGNNPLITLFDEKYDDLSAHNLFVIRIDFDSMTLTKTELMTRLKEMGIGTQVHFIPLYKHSYFRKHHPVQDSDFPNTEAFYKKALSLPLYPHLKVEEVERICGEINRLICDRPF